MSVAKVMGELGTQDVLGEATCSFPANQTQNNHSETVICYTVWPIT